MSSLGLKDRKTSQMVAGMGLYSSFPNDTKMIADNESYVLGIIDDTCDPPIAGTLGKLGLPYSRTTTKSICKLIKEALKLGWFDHIGFSVK